MGGGKRMTALTIAFAIILAAVLVALVIANHTHTVQQIADAQTYACALQKPIDEVLWLRRVAQLIMDGLGESVEISGFVDLLGGANAWLRFVGRDGRAYVFATQPMLPDCVGRGRLMDVNACGELHALWQYFAQHNPHATPLRRGTVWYALPPQSPLFKPAQRPRMQIAGPMQGLW